MNDYYNNDKCINVVFSSDSDYFVPTYIAIYSLLSNYKGTRSIIIYILCNDKYPVLYRIYFDNLTVVFADINVSFSFINMGDKYGNVKICNERLSASTMYRLSIPNLLNHVDRCIYLDSDVIVQGDISDLYDFDLDGMLVGGVRDIYIPDEDYSRISSIIGIPAMDQYFNAGVILMDLEAIRKRHLNEKLELTGLYSDYYPFNDQDVLNTVFYNNIKLLPFKYNMKIGYTHNSGEKYILLFGKEDYINAIENPIIIHYISYLKPWSYPRWYGANYWWKYIKAQEKDIMDDHIRNFLKKERVSFRKQVEVFLLSNFLIKWFLKEVHSFYRVWMRT